MLSSPRSGPSLHKARTAQPRPWERRPPGQVVRQAERLAQGARLVLVKLVQRLDDLALSQELIDDADAVVGAS